MSMIDATARFKKALAAEPTAWQPPFPTSRAHSRGDAKS